MNMRRPKRRIEMPAAALADARRIEEIWSSCREAHGSGGPFLFGRFTAADAMYAPVVNRFDVYDIPASQETRAYMEAVMGLPAWHGWSKAAAAEPWVIEADEA
jgi:glutathione S-transferase